MVVEALFAAKGHRISNQLKSNLSMLEFHMVVAWLYNGIERFGSDCTKSRNKFAEIIISDFACVKAFNRFLIS